MNMHSEPADPGAREAVPDITLDIRGMTCAGCATKVEQTLQAVSGVKDASVNLAFERATILPRGDLSAETVVQAVEALGYGAVLRSGDARDRQIQQDRLESERRSEERWALLIFVFAALFSLPFLIQMVAMFAGLGWHMPPWLELSLAAPVQIVAGARFYRGAYRSIAAGSANMDVLVALGTSAAFLYSLWTLFRLGSSAGGQLYFEAAVVILTLVLLGKLLESRAKRRTTSAIRSLMALRPETATRLTGGAQQTVAIDDLRLDDHVLVRPGERVPVDGIITNGASEFDEALITGESVPVVRRSGDNVVAGTINASGSVEIAVTALGEDTTLARIIRMVENAQTGKAPVQKLVDRISAVFVPVVLVLALLTLIGWLIAGQGFESALIASVSVLVIACPCALGLATPTALVAGTGAAARAGILIKNIDALEIAHRVNTVVFDKTGTLTEGAPRVVDIVPLQGDEESVLRLAASLQQNSEHPLAKSIVRKAEARGLKLESVSGFRNEAGKGVMGKVGTAKVAIGNPAMMDGLGIDTGACLERLRELESEAKTTVIIAKDGKAVGLIALQDPLRVSSSDAVRSLAEAGVSTSMLTGDSPPIAADVAERLELDSWSGSVLPDGKAKHVETMRRDGAVVAMVGDGVNDAPALAAADLGIAVGTGADVAMETASITLMRPDPRLVPAALRVSRATLAKIRQNLFWAFIYNLIGIPLAMAGMLSPALAGAAMALSSVSGVTNSALLRRWRPED